MTEKQMSVKAVSLEELLKKAFVIHELDGTFVGQVLISDDKLVKLDDVLTFVAIEKNKQKMKEEKMWNAHQETIDKLIESKFKHGAFVAGLRDLRNDFPTHTIEFYESYPSQVKKEQDEWKKRFDVALEGAVNE